jgi:hypothetical protein
VVIGVVCVAIVFVCMLFVSLNDAYSKKNKLLKLKLVNPIIEQIMPIIAEEEPEDFDEDSPARVCVPC